MVLPVVLVPEAVPVQAPARPVPRRVRRRAGGGEPVAGRQPHPLRRSGALLHQRRAHDLRRQPPSHLLRRGHRAVGARLRRVPGAEGRPLGGLERAAQRRPPLHPRSPRAPARGRRGADRTRVEPLRAGAHGPLQRERGPRRRGVVGRVLRVLGAGALRGRRWGAAASAARADHAAGLAVRDRDRHRGRDLRHHPLPHPRGGEPGGARGGGRGPLVGTPAGSRRSDRSRSRPPPSIAGP